MTKTKRIAIINGKPYGVYYPVCGGCENLCVGGICVFPGEGCEYPVEREQYPQSPSPDGLCFCGNTKFVYHDWGSKECPVCRSIFDSAPGGLWVKREAQP